LGELAVITFEEWCVRFLVTEGMGRSVLDRSYGGGFLRIAQVFD
jgi:hypothetical protein